jgi:hypothetical protein
MTIDENIENRNSLDYLWNVEATRIFQDITYDLLEKAINKLEPEEKILIRLSYGLRKREDQMINHPKLPRQEIAKMLSVGKHKALQMRIEAERKIFNFITSGDLTA